MTLLVVTGLQRERRILAAPGLEVVAGGGDGARLEAELDRRAAGARGLISLGIAGALAPGLRPGDWVVATAVLEGTLRSEADPAWAARLLAGLPGAVSGAVLGVDAMVAEAREKAARHRESGALAVDMESHVAARVARRHGIPLAVARVVSDAAHRDLPPAARLGMRPDGGMDLPAVLRALLADPRQLPALVRTGLEAERAFRALLRGHRRLGPGLAGPGTGADLGQLPLDMA
ncbi:hopanoid-associated phosphorylase [Roseomonas nepalensis]|uniref:Hopanoid-associated phosphorylase n=1 Tax=Muricoccus nepalensis TaxID=1854500 RepID=A0A502GI21_9PROT|nr:hopanoid-associated phosphorylase [Roseomonas nepalensis]TPG60606.1 hopanoid-associated phosphorylase [Roseomonas nepalensis]